MGDRKVITAIQKMAGTFKNDPVKLISGTVKSVDEAKSTCVVTTVSGDTEIDIPNVKLQCGVCDGLLILPVKDSEVLLITSNYLDSYVIQFSDVDKYFLQVDKAVLEINNDGKLMLNDGSFDGLVKVKDLTDKLNALENLVNNLLTTLKSTTIPLAPSGSYPFAPLYASFNNISPITQQSDIENPDIKHGKPA